MWSSSATGNYRCWPRRDIPKAQVFLVWQAPVLRGHSFPGGPGKSDSPAAFRQLIDSFTGKLLPLPDDTAVYPGHGLDTTIGEARDNTRILLPGPTHRTCLET